MSAIGVKQTLSSSSQPVREGQRIAELEAEIDALQRQALALGEQPTADVSPWGLLGVKIGRAAWFMAHRIRAAMTPATGGKLGGEGKLLESDEIFIGCKAKTAHKSKPVPRKHAVHALVERGGEARMRHVADVTARTLGEVLEAGGRQISAAHR
jgi:hypothetical protein